MTDLPSEDLDVATRQHRGGARKSTYPAPDTCIGLRTARGSTDYAAPKVSRKSTRVPEAGYDDHTDRAPTTPEPLLLFHAGNGNATAVWRGEPLMLPPGGRRERNAGRTSALVEAREAHSA
jgi:hypothetical protein